MVKVIVGSKNPIKIEAVKAAFSNYFKELKVIGISVESDVSDQPKDYDETLQGARNRVLNLRKENDADFFVGIEGGMDKKQDKWFSYGCIVVLDSSGNEGVGLSSHFETPKKIVKELFNGKELGHVIDDLSSNSNSKQKGGASAFLTNGVLHRKDLYYPGIICALAPLINKKIYS
ncbi:inosine/xanthosine triphosphatase [Candidatus Woesearchaeota archaeon]|nr:MAG: inosine/xanthosine triphosphatase [Candidatus Woesearchaeota archaeon]